MPGGLASPQHAAGKGGEPFTRQRVGPWVPVMPLIMGPLETGGDTQIDGIVSTSASSE
jgi:hypothetical protein